jgi:low affinity Fe/Cu permease
MATAVSHAHSRRAKRARNAAHAATYHPSANLFERFAHTVAHAAGKPAAFLTALTVVLVWLASGPLFGFSDSWQLIINTGTTIVTFLMVFLIQQSQNRDTMAVQVKLAELIIAAKGAKNTLATAEDMSEQELTELHQSYCRLADQTLAHLNARRGKKNGKAGG